MSRQLVLGIDGGQTKTRAALATLDGTVVLRILAGPWDTTKSRSGRSKCRAALAAVSAAVTAFDADATITSVCIGMTGGLSGRSLVAGWCKRLFNCSAVSVSPDMVTNLKGANPQAEDGVVVIAGGGSVAWGRTSNGEEALAGGYGYLIGDAGSAYEIGRQAMGAALMAQQGRARHTALAEAITQHFGVSNIWEARVFVYSGDAREYISSLAPLVSQLALRGDEPALRIVREAGEALADMAASVISRLALREARVYPTGGVLGKNSPVRNELISALARIKPDARVLEPQMPPLGGALAIALHDVGALTASSLAQLRLTLNQLENQDG